MSGAPKLKRLLSRTGLYGALTLFIVFSAGPFYVMLISTFKTSHGLMNPANNPFFFVEPPTLDNLRFLFGHSLFLRFLLNTTLVGAAVVAITVLVAVPAAYSLARLAGSWGQYLGIGIFLTYLIPPTLLFIPMTRVVSDLGLQNSLWSLVLTYPTFTLPFCIWLMTGFFMSTPRELEEQAMIDGCSHLGAFVRVVLPLSVPGIVTVVVFAFTLVANEYIYALAFIQSSTEKTIGIGVTTELIRGDVFYWGALMAGALVASIPVAIVYTAFLDRIVKGLAGGAGH